MKPLQLHAGDPALADVLDLLRDAFTYMDGVVDPPSSIHQMTAQKLDEVAAKAEVWTLPVACVILTPQPETLYLGKLATARSHRGQGLARILVDHAVKRARALGLPSVTLETRIELADNHAAFRAMGFVETARTAHPGYSQPTAITFTRTH